MKKLIKIEEAIQFALATLALYYLNAPWWCYLLLLLGPDISMAGYLAGNKAGAWSYNLFHHKGVALILFGVSLFAECNPLMLAGIILFGHSAMDRMFGYGLKYTTGFAYTHLGKIGKHKEDNQQI